MWLKKLRDAYVPQLEDLEMAEEAYLEQQRSSEAGSADGFCDGDGDVRHSDISMQLEDDVIGGDKDV